MTYEGPVSFLLLQGITYSDRAWLLPELGLAIEHAGGWVLERRVISASVAEMQIEMQTSAVLEIYAALLECGLQLTRSSHRALTGAWSCGRRLHTNHLPSILSLRLEMSFLPEPPKPMDLAHRLYLGAARA